MATRCISISENKKISTQSPIAIGAFVILFVILNIFMKADFLFVILTIVIFIATQILFQYKPRYVYLSYIYTTKHSHLSPRIKDYRYFLEEEKIKEIAYVLNEYELEEKAQKKASFEKRKLEYQKYLETVSKR